MNVHPRAIALMHAFEGCRLAAYMPTPNDRPTIGWGMTFYPDGKPVRMGDTITQAKADADFVAVVEQFAAKLRPLVGEATPLQFGAMVCLAYNIGMGPVVWRAGMRSGFRQSTVLRLHKAGDWKGAARAFGMWNRQAGRVLSGLTRRRAAEAALYLSAA
jgi:lysozyme